MKTLIENILKPKSSEEIEESLKNISDEKLYDIVKSNITLLSYAVKRESPELNGQLLIYLIKELCNFRIDDKVILKLLKNKIDFNSIKNSINIIFKNNKSKTYSNILYHLIQKIDKRDLSYDKNLLIRLASIYGFKDLVIKLMKNPNIDPSDSNNGALTGAIIYEHHDIMELLLKDERVRNKMSTNEK